MAPASAADDEALVAATRDILNAVYAETAGDLFHPGTPRTQSEEIAGLIRKEQLALAYLVPVSNGSTEQAPASIPATADRVIGCVSIKRLSPTLGQLGMLAVDAGHHGSGSGRRLFEFAEERCRSMGCETAQVELFVPTEFHHEFKMRLKGWYERMGYEFVRLAHWFHEDPALASTLAVPVEVQVFEKRLK
jgi:GNAT superfamily N-acetyltransferase